MESARRPILFVSLPESGLLNPLLAVIREQSLIDDLQFEEVQAEFKRTGKPIDPVEGLRPGMSAIASWAQRGR